MNNGHFTPDGLATGRRQFLAGGAGLAALGVPLARPLLARTAPSSTALRLSPTMILRDDRHQASRAFAAAAARPGVTVLAVAGDPAETWFNHLRPALRGGNVVLAGMTDTAFLFCLEQFARSFRMGARARVDHLELADGSFEHCLAGCAQPAGISPTRWALQMPEIVTTLTKDRLGAESRWLARQPGRGAPGAGALVSWSMASHDDGEHV